MLQCIRLLQMQGMTCNLLRHLRGRSGPFLGFQSVVQRRPSNRALCCRLDYPGIGPEHSYLKDLGRAEYYAVTDAQALDAFVLISRLEGIIPALETSHAFAYLDK